MNRGKWNKKNLSRQGSFLLWGLLLVLGEGAPLRGQVNPGSPPPLVRAGLRLVHAAGTTNRIQFLMNGKNLGRNGLLPGYAGGVAGFPAGKGMFAAKSGDEPVSPPLAAELFPGRNVAVVAFLEPVPPKDRQPGKPDKKLALLAISQEPIPEGQSRFRLLLVGEPTCEFQCNDQKITLEGGKIQTVGGAPKSVILRQEGKEVTECKSVKPGDWVIILYRDAAGAWAATQYEDRVARF